MRIIHTSDWHFGRTLEGRSRMPEQESFVDELCLMVEEEKIDLVLVAGDVFDTVNPPAAAEQLFYESMARLANGGKRKVVVIAGNHDNPDRLSAAHSLALEQGIILLGSPIAEMLTLDFRNGERATLFALPYPSESRLQTLLSQSNEEELLRKAYDESMAFLFQQQSQFFRPDTINLAMSHLYVLGSAESESERPIQVGGAYTVSASTLPATAQYVALGHLHRPQNVGKAPTLARYAGSPLAYSFSEAGQAKSVTLVEAKAGKEAEMKEIFLASGRPLVRWQAREGIAQVYGWLEEGRDANAWIDLEVHVEDTLPLEEIQRLRKSHSGIIHIRPVYIGKEQETSPSIRKGLPIDQMFVHFYEQQTGGAKPDEETVKLFLSLIGEDDSEPAGTDEGGENR